MKEVTLEKGFSRIFIHLISQLHNIREDSDKESQLLPVNARDAMISHSFKSSSIKKSFWLWILTHLSLRLDVNDCQDTRLNSLLSHSRLRLLYFEYNTVLT